MSQQVDFLSDGCFHIFLGRGPWQLELAPFSLANEMQSPANLRNQ
jgi:hypothetical protein